VWHDVWALNMGDSESAHIHLRYLGGCVVPVTPAAVQTWPIRRPYLGTKLN